MRTSAIRLILWVPFLVILTSVAMFAQTTAKQSASGTDSDPLLKDILNEVRQMRAEMQRATVYSHRSQVLLERIKVEQDQIARVTRDVADAHDQIETVRKQMARKQIEVDQAIKMKNVGALSEPALNQVTSQLEELQQREQNLLGREAMISAELDISKKTLDDLDKRLSDLDREISKSATDTGAKKP